MWGQERACVHFENGYCVITTCLLEPQEQCHRSVNKAARVRRALAFKLRLVGSKGGVTHLLLLRTLVRLWEAVPPTKVQTTVRALPDNLDSSIATLLLGACAILAALLCTATEAQH